MARSGAFTARDLAFFVPDDNVGDVRALRHRIDDEDDGSGDLMKPKIDMSKKTTRYFSGKAPVWVKGGASGPGTINNNGSSSSTASSTVESKTETASAISTDSRYARLMASAGSTVPVSSRARRIVSSGVIENPEPEIETTAALSSMHETRSVPEAQVLERLDSCVEDESLQENDLTSIPEVDRSSRLSRAPTSGSRFVDSEESEESEYETVTDDSSAEEEQVMLRAVFVPKHKRNTIVAEEDRQREEELKHNKELLRKEERRRATRMMVAESIQKTEAAENDPQDGLDSDEDCPLETDEDLELGMWDDSDLISMAFPEELEKRAGDEMSGHLSVKQTQFNELVSELRKWKVRELHRCLAEAKEAEERAKEAAELKRLHAMTDEERMKEKAKEQKTSTALEKPKWKFLQKYYHKGAFFHDQDAPVLRGDSATLGDSDRQDKSVLPKILQVKNFGMRGRTKYTHLVDQDTTFAGKFEKTRRDELIDEGYQTSKSMPQGSSSNYKKQRVVE